MDISYLLNLAALISAGALVGFIVGLTGVGGGSLMTPALISGFGVAPIIAVGTDLAFAAITKSVGIGAHRGGKAIQWPIVKRMMWGSIPACLVAIIGMRYFELNARGVVVNQIVHLSLGIALVGTAIAVAGRDRLLAWSETRSKAKFPAQPLARLGNDTKRIILTVLFSALIGALVALSSIGAGAIGCTLLALLYREFDIKQIAATDMAYAVPLTAIASIGHGFSNHIDWQLLITLLVGSVPAIWIGVKVSQKIDGRAPRWLLSILLLGAGIKSLASV
jgi:uncharacterized protein